MSEARFDIIDQPMDRTESNILAIRASMARLEGALPHIAAKEDVAEAMLHATKSQRAMVASIVAPGIAVAGVAAILGPAQDTGTSTRVFHTTCHLVRYARVGRTRRSIQALNNVEQIANGRLQPPPAAGPPAEGAQSFASHDVVRRRQLLR